MIVILVIDWNENYLLIADINIYIDFNTTNILPLFPKENSGDDILQISEAIGSSENYRLSRVVIILVWWTQIELEIVQWLEWFIVSNQLWNISFKSLLRDCHISELSFNDVLREYNRECLLFADQVKIMRVVW